MDFDKNNLSGKIGSMRQIASVRRAVLDDGKGRGMRIIDVDNGSGIRFTVYPDRGMDIGEASFHGTPIAWLPAEPAVAASYDPAGINWLRSWGGGMLTSCGLINVGGPCEAGGDSHGLHGRLSHIPATEVNTESKWLPDGSYRLTVSGKVIHSRVFGEQLILTRKISCIAGENTITIEDSVENAGFAEQPLMLLYHMNFGWPLVNENSFLTPVDHPVVPQGEVAAKGLTNWDKMEPSTPGFAEQVFYHDLPADADGMSAISLINPDEKIKLTVSCRKAELPYIVQWKQMGQGEYVLGIEPGNCIPENQNNNRDKGILRTIAAGTTVNHKVTVTLESLD
ncbi:MAG: DUF4432 family protein [Lentisphaerae bacterium]|nr:DUF4432 family protein [Lentisphaerota bacterium]